MLVARISVHTYAHALERIVRCEEWFTHACWGLGGAVWWEGVVIKSPAVFAAVCFRLALKAKSD